MASNIAEVQLKKIYCLRSRWSGDIWSPKIVCVFGDGVFTGNSCLFLCNLHSQGSSAVVLVPGRVSQGCPGRTDGKLALLRNSKDKRYWAKAVSDEYTHIHFMFFQLSWKSLATDILLWSSSHCFLSFSFFLWIQAGFEAKAAFVPNRFVNLPTNLPASTSNFTITLKSYTQMYR